MKNSIARGYREITKGYSIAKECRKITKGYGIAKEYREITKGYREKGGSDERN